MPRGLSSSTKTGRSRLQATRYQAGGGQADEHRPGLCADGRHPRRPGRRAGPVSPAVGPAADAGEDSRRRSDEHGGRARFAAAADQQRSRPRWSTTARSSSFRSPASRPTRRCWSSCGTRCRRSVVAGSARLFRRSDDAGRRSGGAAGAPGAYLPEEQKLLGIRGPWTDESAPPWSAGRAPKASDATLLAEVRQGINCDDRPARIFRSMAGGSVFSTLRPEPAAAGPLHLTTLHRNIVNCGVFLLVADRGPGAHAAARRHAAVVAGRPVCGGRAGGRLCADAGPGDSGAGRLGPGHSTPRTGMSALPGRCCWCWSSGPCGSWPGSFPALSRGCSATFKQRPPRPWPRGEPLAAEHTRRQCREQCVAAGETPFASRRCAGTPPSDDVRPGKEVRAMVRLTPPLDRPRGALTLASTAFAQQPNLLTCQARRRIAPPRNLRARSRTSTSSSKTTSTACF